MTVSRPISAQAKGALESIVPAAVQMPKAMIPIEIWNEIAAFMLASISKKSVQLEIGTLQPEQQNPLLKLNATAY